MRCSSCGWAALNVAHFPRLQSRRRRKRCPPKLVRNYFLPCANFHLRFIHHFTCASDLHLIRSKSREKIATFIVSRFTWIDCVGDNQSSDKVSSIRFVGFDISTVHASFVLSARAHPIYVYHLKNLFTISIAIRKRAPIPSMAHMVCSLKCLNLCLHALIDDNI